MESAFIDDGYETDGRLAGIPGLFPPIAFRYRPAVASAHNAVMRTEEGTPERERATCKLLASHVVSWDVKNQKGEPVAVSEDAFSRLQSLPQAQLYNVVIGASLSAKEERKADAGN